MDRVDYIFYGFLPQVKQNDQDAFIQHFNFRREQITNQNDENQKNELISLEEYLNIISSFKQKKKEMLNDLNKIETIQENPQLSKHAESIQVAEVINKGLHEALVYFEEIEEYMQYDQQQTKIKQQIQKDNMQKKNQTETKIKKLQKNTLKNAWQLLYHNPLSKSVKQCFITLKLQWNYLSWLYYAYREIKLSKEINECTINMSNLNLQDKIIKKMSDYLFSIVNQCDNIIVYKLLMRNNKLNDIDKLILLFPPKVIHLTLELQNNQLLDNSFKQFYIFDCIQILTLYIENNPNLTSECLTNLTNHIHRNLEVELFISENLYQNDSIIDFVGKCHSLKINDKQLIYNDSFMLEVQLENINEMQFLKLTAIMNKINFDQQSQQNPVSMQDKLFNFSSRQNFGSKNQKSAKLINLEEDNKDRRNQQGSQPQLPRQSSQTKTKSQADLDTSKKDLQSNQILEKGKPVSNEEQKDEDEDDDIELTEKKDIILQINGIKILDTSDDSQLTLNLSQFDMSIFDDRNLYKMIGKLPKIPTNLQVKNYEDMQEKDKQIIKLILSRRDNIITINEKTYDMKSCVINLSHFSEVEHELEFLTQSLQQNTSIEKLEVQIDSSKKADIILNNLIKQYDSLEFPKLKQLIIFTDISQDLFFYQNPNRKYTLVITTEMPLFRKLSDNVIRVNSVVPTQGQFNLQ
ncbi:hypothetical protein ABPG72_007438 [Tetrahymena utriculariae]